jgi:predicted phosphodiesterase
MARRNARGLPSVWTKDKEMKRLKHNINEDIPSKKADAIFTADWHLREDTPTCYTGDFQTEQWTSTDFISALQRQHECPVIHAGDLFHHWKPSPYLLSQAIKHLPRNFFTVYGQHDLPQHSWDLREKSGIHTLERAETLKVLNGCHFGQEPLDDKDGVLRRFSMLTNTRNILVWHHMTYITPPFPGATGGNAMNILKKYPAYDLIVTGDNHQSFYVEHEGRLLVNPGSLTRQTAAQIDFKPSVYLWYADTNAVKQVFVPIEEGVISREHIEVVEQRDARIDAFISRLDGQWDTAMSFEENLERFKEANNISTSVINIIYKAIEQ